VMSTAAFDKYIQDDIAKWARVIHSAHITAE
jgi:tripartite-type tricarboxylate transporter receptor subunit TctC